MHIGHLGERQVRSRGAGNRAHRSYADSRLLVSNDYSPIYDTNLRPRRLIPSMIFIRSVFAIKLDRTTSSENDGLAVSMDIIIIAV